MYLELRSFFILDSGLLPSFVYTFPLSELIHLFEVLNPFYALMWLGSVYGSDATFHVTDPFDKEKVCIIMYLTFFH